MFRWFFRKAVRFVRRGIPPFRQEVLERTRQASNVQHVGPSCAVVQQSSVNVNFIGESFFRHWIDVTSRATRLKCNPVQRMMLNQRNSSPLFLAFVGFAYIGTTEKDNLSSRKCTKKDPQSNRLLQNALKTTFEKIPEKSINHEGNKLKDYEICERLGKSSSNAAVYAAKLNNNPCALKMLFNYAANSQSHSLHKAFLKELTVLSGGRNKKNTEEGSHYITLPCHFNIMNIIWHFADKFPDDLPDAMDSYPAVVQYGRNRTMFLVMPRYSGTLSEYLSVHQGNIPTETSLALLTQLLEGLVHLNSNGVAHRDLKNDNVLVEETPEGLLPHLIITDLGCCLAEKEIGLVLPYETDEISKGGNTELMAPEVACAKPGRGHAINYSKADEWAAGALAYEMFGQKNPFEGNSVEKKTYESHDLPELTNARKTIRKLVKQLLQRHPNDRPSVSLAATVCHLLLWAPQLCNACSSKDDLSEEVEMWFTDKTFRLTMEMLQYKSKDVVPLEQQILYTFLSRTSVQEIAEALQWLGTGNE